MSLTIIGAVDRLPVAAAKPLRYGDGRLVVFGMRSADILWHVARRGSWDAPQDASGKALVVGTSLCRNHIVMNGYCSDFMPPKNMICPACLERL